MDRYLPRVVDEIIDARLRTFGGVVLGGPRAAGKTRSGLRHSASAVQLDSDPRLAELAQTAPSFLLAGETPRLIDEWQLAPNIWNVVRHEIDERSQPGQFILTGSATPADRHTHHSGAGRFARIMVRTMSLAESGDSTGQVTLSALLRGDAAAGMGGPDVPTYAALLARGGWPALVTNHDLDPLDYLQGYIDDAARVDLAAAGISADPIRVAALIRAIARNVSTERPATKLAAEAEVSAQSVRAYVDALTRIFLVEEQPAWAPHLRSSIRLRSAPKWHFVDPSVAVAAMDAEPSRLLADLETFGLLFESLCVRDLRIYAQACDGAVYHYRDGSGLEVDAIVERRDGTWCAFEIKMGGDFAIDQAATHLKALRAKVSDQRQHDLAALVVLTAGATSYVRPDGVNVVAIGHLAP